MLYLMSCHFDEERVMVCINRYFYEVFFKEPGLDGLDLQGRPIRLVDMFHIATRFIGTYFEACCKTGEVTGDALESIIDEIFPEMIPFMLEFRCMKGIKKPKPQSTMVNFDDLSFHLETLLPTDWTSLIHIAGLEEKRRGLNIR